LSSQEFPILASFKIQNLIPFERALDAAKKKYDAIPPSLQGIDKKFAELNTKVNSFKTSLDRQSQTLESTRQKFTSFGTAIGTNLTSLSTLSLSVVNFQRTLADLEDTQILVDRAALKVSRTQEAQSKAQDKVNQLTKDGMKGTAEYEQALNDLTQAEDAAKLAVTMHGEALEDQQRAYQDFYMSFIPTAISSVSTLATVLGSIKGMGVGSFSGLKGIFTSILGGATSATGAVKGLDFALNNLGKFTIIGLAIGAIAGLIKMFYDLGQAVEDSKKKMADIDKNVIFPAAEFMRDLSNKSREEKMKFLISLSRQRRDLQKEFDNFDLGFFGNFDMGKVKQKEDLGGKIHELDSKISTTMRDIQAMPRTILPATMAFENQTTAISGYSSALENMANLTNEANKNNRYFGWSLLEQIDLIERRSKALQASNDAMALIEQTLRLTDIKLEEHGPAIQLSQETRDAVEQTQKELQDRIKQSWADFWQNSEDMFDSKELKKHLKGLGFSKDEVKRQMGLAEIQDVVDDTMTNIADSLSRMFALGTTQKEFGNWADNVLEGMEKSWKGNKKLEDILKPVYDAIKSSTTKEELLTNLAAVFTDPVAWSKLQKEVPELTTLFEKLFSQSVADVDANNIMPSLNLNTDTFDKLLKTEGKGKKKKGSLIAVDTTAFEESMAGIKEVINGVSSSFSILGRVLLNIADDYGIVAKSVNALISITNTENRQTLNTVKNFNTLGRVLLNITDDYGEVGDGISDVIKTTNTFNRQLVNTTKNLDSAAEAAQDYADALNDVPGNVSTTFTVKGKTTGAAKGISNSAFEKAFEKQFAAEGFIGKVRKPTWFLIGEGGEEEDVAIIPNSKKSQFLGNAKKTNGSGASSLLTPALSAVSETAKKIINIYNTFEIKGNDIITSRKFRQHVQQVLDDDSDTYM